ncbi:MAG TPA: ABC transporter substrate-binding protein, partial [Chloroflexota bacterium]|nr:ABC transporter substrate-binding protein [Chloroflexota bacterium]
MKYSVRSLLRLGAAGLIASACAPTAQRPTSTPAAGAGTAPGTSGQAQPAGAPQRGGTLVVAVRESVLGLDPANHRSRVTETVIRSMFDGLVTRLPDGKVVPEIASAWKQVAPDTYEFTIRQGIKFHDGQPLTAEDVQFSLERVALDGRMEGQTSPRQSLVPAVAEVSAPDPALVRIKLQNPVPEALLLAGLVQNQIVPRKYVEQVGGAGLSERPVGCGPFKLVEARLDQQVVMERFDDYYGGSPEMPPVSPAFLDRLVYRISPEHATAVALLKTGETHILQGVLVTSLAELRQDTNIQVKTYDGTRTTWFAMNVKQPPLDKVEVRRALNHALNVDAIISRVLEGQAVRMNGAVPPFSQYYDSSIKPYEFNPTRAKQLLQQAGASSFQLTLDTIA